MNNKLITKLFFSLFTALSTVSLSANIDGQKLTSTSPTVVEFAFDIHDVIVKKAIFAMIGDTIKISQKRKRLKSKNRILHIKLKELDKKSGSTSEAYVQLCLAYGETKLADLYRKRAAKQSLIKDMKELVQELYAMGYTLRPCSNIGPLCFQDLQAKHWDVFAYFKPGTTASYQPGEESIIKPDPQFYKMHNDNFNADGKKTFIFIDDKSKNVLGARKAGWIGLLFKGVKQLRSDLRALGINVKKK